MNKERIEEVLKNLGAEELPADVLEIAEHKSRDFEKTLTQSKQPKFIVLKDYIMKTKLTKLAAVAVIIIAVTAGVLQFSGGTVTWAKVIEPILNARTVVLDLVVGSEETGLVVHDIIVGSKIRRTIPNMGSAIIDIDNARMLRLDPLDKKAVYIDIQGPFQQWARSYLGIVRDIVADVENHPEWPIQELGQQLIDGQRAVGFLLSEPNIKLTIWADAETAMPIRIEMLTGPSQTIIKNIEFDVSVDESLVSMDVPDGYTLYEGELDYTDFDEQDFIVVLQFWAEHVLGGNFPDRVSAEDILKVAPVLRQMVDQLNISDEDKIQIGAAMGRGFMFFRQLDPRGIEWHYAGSGVKIAEAGKVVFWYRPEGSPNYRVIYGDLTVKDVAPENLPE
jgi:hypothetical protein